MLLAPGAPDGSGGPTRALARVVVPAADYPCPSLVPGPLAMTPRANPNPATFAVTVCEAVYPFDATLVVEPFGIRLPAVRRRQPTRIVVVGDTGCEDDQDQDCATGWPFGALATTAAALGPELVIHVGDYNYRGTPFLVDGGFVYDGCGDDPYVTQNPANDPGGATWDRWESWRDDFFRPAASLLARAPWVFIRGNHELCSRAGPGYFYFLDPHSSLLGHDLARYRCPPQVSGGDPFPNLVFVPPYVLTFDEGWTLVVADSAGACDSAQPTRHAVDIYTAQFARIRGVIDGRYAWLATHRPIWAVFPENARVDCAVDQGSCDNAVLQQAVAASPGGALPPAVQLGLYGHLHFFEALTFDAPGRPPSLVIGDSGVAISPTPVSSFTVEGLDGQDARGVKLDRFGFLDVSLSADGAWHGQLLDTRGTDFPLAVCGTAQLTATGDVCRLTGN